MESKFWLNKWIAGETQFHQSEFEPLLIKYFPKLSPTSVFVPLCGKSRDMVWLAEQGHQVIGVELSPIACHEFFSENYDGIYQEEKDGPFTVFRGTHITLYCGDFFQLEPQHIKQVTALYDRAALIALPPDMRKKYVSHLLQLFVFQKIKAQILLLTLEYAQEKVQGPPFSVSHSEVRELYHGSAKISQLFHQEDPAFSEGNQRFKNIQVFENAHQIELL